MTWDAINWIKTLDCAVSNVFSDVVPAKQSGAARSHTSSVSRPSSAPLTEKRVILAPLKKPYVPRKVAVQVAAAFHLSIVKGSPTGWILRIEPQPQNEGCASSTHLFGTPINDGEYMLLQPSLNF